MPMSPGPRPGPSSIHKTVRDLSESGRPDYKLTTVVWNSESTSEGLSKASLNFISAELQGGRWICSSSSGYMRVNLNTDSCQYFMLLSRPHPRCPSAVHTFTTFTPCQCDARWGTALRQHPYGNRSRDIHNDDVARSAPLTFIDLL